VFNSLFGEVTEAKSLLEQVALVCQGRGDMYQVCLKAVQRLVKPAPWWSLLESSLVAFILHAGHCSFVLSHFNAYSQTLSCIITRIIIHRYVEEDLKQGLGKEPAQVLSARPMDDPLEIILYLTRSVITLTLNGILFISRHHYKTSTTSFLPLKCRSPVLHIRHRPLTPPSPRPSSRRTTKETPTDPPPAVMAIGCY
jgi:hypothetical protein